MTEVNRIVLADSGLKETDTWGCTVDPSRAGGGEGAGAPNGDAVWLLLRWLELPRHWLL